MYCNVNELKLAATAGILRHNVGTIVQKVVDDDRLKSNSMEQINQISLPHMNGGNYIIIKHDHLKTIFQTAEWPNCSNLR